jgi:hypothetical protein
LEVHRGAGEEVRGEKVGKRGRDREVERERERERFTMSFNEELFFDPSDPLQRINVLSPNTFQNSFLL